MSKKRETEAEREERVSRTHARLYRERQEELARNPTLPLEGIIELLFKAREQLAATPDSHEWTPDQVETLMQCRSQCLGTAGQIESILRRFKGMA